MFVNLTQIVVLVLDRTPTARILKSHEPVDKTASTVVSFSSRGPNQITLDILKVLSYRFHFYGVTLVDVPHLMLKF